MVASTHPLIGLPHKCDVVRKVPVDDGAGGIAEGDAEVVVYPKRTCRVSSLDPNDIELRGYGFDPKRHMKVVAVYSPKVMEVDFLKIPWGVPPNVVAPIGLPDGFASTYTLMVTVTPSAFSPLLLTPPFTASYAVTTTVVLVWDGTQFADEGVNFRVFWTGSVWRFEDLVNEVSHDFVGFREEQNIFRRPWEVEVGTGYSIVGNAVGAVPLRIVWVKHQIDEIGRMHHTSLVIQLEGPDS